MSKSFLAKLTSSQSKPAKSVGGSTSSWTATLNRQDNTHLCLSSAHVVVSSPPLSASKIDNGCICRVFVGAAIEPFLISIDSTSISPTLPANSIAICPRLLESIGVGKDVKSVTIEEISDNEVFSKNTLSDLVISINDRYVSKRDLWSFQIRLLGSVVYRSLSPPFSDMLKCSAVKIEDLSNSVSGIVGPQTRVIIRSNSSQIVLIISITSDLWEIDSMTKEVKFSKFISAICDGLGRAKMENRNHHLLLIGTVRPVKNLSPTEKGGRDIYEIMFEGQMDEFSVSDFQSKLVSFFNFWPMKIAWTDCPFGNQSPVTDYVPNWFSPPTELDSSHANFVRDNTVCGCKIAGGSHKLSSSMIPCHSSESNILESINLALNHFGKHHMDRRLRVTGTQISLISSCNGIFAVSDKLLVDITRKRVESTSCSIRVISVGDKPVCPKSPVTVLVGSDQLALPWLWFSFYTSQFAAPNGRNRMESTIGEFSRRIAVKSAEKNEDIFVRSATSLKPPANLATSLASSRTARISAEKLYRKSTHAREKRTDHEIVDLAIVTPRLQRVAIEASVKSSDIKPIDNWTVPGEALKTFHDLIGTRLAMDMQLIDASGTWDTSGPVEQGSSSSREKLSTSFGVLVSRSSMRDTHIQKVMIKGEDKCVWVLNRLESGNIYVSRVNLIGDSTLSPDDHVDEKIENTDFVYDYILISRRLTISSSSPRSVSDIIVCKSCQEIDLFVSYETRKFSIPPPLPWNLLDDVIANPYMQQSLPSTVPNNQSIPQELVGIRWKFRSAIRTQLFVLVPKEAEFSHSFASTVSLGSCDSLTSPTGQSSQITSRLLDWTTKVGQKIGTPLPVSIGGGGRKSTTGFVPTLVRQPGSDWFVIHTDPNFVFPKLFVVSIEWILCQSSVIESVIESMKQFAIEDGFQFIQIPHSQIFPQPALSNSTEILFDELPFHQKMIVKLPTTINPMCYHFLVSRMVDQMGLLVLFSSREYSHPEGFSVPTNEGKIMVFSRKPGWILMEKTGLFYVAISAKEVEWIPSRLVDSNCDHMVQSFLKWKEIIHTSIVDSTSKI